ncbi:MAG: ATP-binding protein [[Clostridium] scindens]
MDRRERPRLSVDYGDIQGQEAVKRAAEVAVAGGHNLLHGGTSGRRRSTCWRKNSHRSSAAYSRKRAWRSRRFTVFLEWWIRTIH